MNLKFVLLVLAVFVLLWLLRSSFRRPPAAGTKPPATPSGEPQAMLKCTQCGVHLPRDEVLPGRGGVFCGEAHRQAYEATHPAP